ncbi:MAG: gamma-glutamyl-phosphate reductase, partial [Proteobacteria bacterium]|nr:gamma-glutamyl-phosphate reductase [Pseudomonadota bacterium]
MSATSARTDQESSSTLPSEIEALAKAACRASATLGELPAERKNAWLSRTAERLEAARESIMAANATDIEAAADQGISAPPRRRLDT